MFLGGCVAPTQMTPSQPEVKITYKSVPTGATIIEDITGKNLGTTPVTLRYSLNAEDILKGSFKAGGLSTHWVDGRKKDGIPISVDFAKKGRILEYTFMAPPFYRDVQQGTITPYQNNPTGDRSSLYAQAKSQYESALAGYNRALKNLNKAKNMKGVTGFLGFGDGSKKSVLSGLVLGAASHKGLQDAERELTIAWEKLERAKAKLRALEY
jgi:hypothetical protein